jgi:hypothetical protein
MPYWLCGKGGALAQVAVYRLILKENDMQVYEKNTISTI